ncbi:protein-tyrosine phosphatase family protein [Loktanella agnita]|uniref:phosphatase domain-containing putative toxin n=1 Tax=Loktanella agnita TaxID=287097 RepID=UPI003985972D
MGVSDWAIHSLAVGGGVLAIAPIPGRSGDYAGDLAQLLEWAPALVVTLTAQAEMDRKDAGGLGVALQAHDIAWRHCPITDFSVPDDDFDWPALRNHALSLLAQGQRVLVHCHGGCGRSGMVCLGLMVAAGEDPDAALTRLRALRPCAVETHAQMAWARGRCRA